LRSIRAGKNNHWRRENAPWFGYLTHENLTKILLISKLIYKSADLGGFGSKSKSTKSPPAIGLIFRDYFSYKVEIGQKVQNQRTYNRAR